MQAGNSWQAVLIKIRKPNSFHRLPGRPAVSRIVRSAAVSTKSSMSSLPVKAAILGTGIFAKDTYLRLFKEFSDRLILKIAWSRSQSSAEEFVQSYAPNASASFGPDGMSAIMSDSEIQLVIVVLPPQSALQAVEAALAAGKHVIEEKPIAPTAQQALQCMQQYRQQAKGGLWMFAENYRFETVFLAAESLTASGKLGTILKIDLVADMALNPSNRYYASAWRRDTVGCPGGQMMESSVHFIAALRLMAKAAGLKEASQVAARGSHNRDDLTPPDTLVGVVTFPAGQEGQKDLAASVSISLAAANFRWSLTVVGTAGSVEVLRGGFYGGNNRVGYVLNTQLPGQEPQSHQMPFKGTDREMAAFLTLIEAKHGGVDGETMLHVDDTLKECHADLLTRSGPEEGFRDLALVEALLMSSEQGGRTVDVLQVQ